jgi:hypothetical protein
MASMITRRFFSTTVRRLQTTTKEELQSEGKRNPEIYVRHIENEALRVGSVMCRTSSLENINS